MKCEAVGRNFDSQKFLLARELTQETVEAVASQVREGMSERDGFVLIDQELGKRGFPSCSFL